MKAVLYFTGTGNSQYLAENLVKLTGDKLISINEAFKTGVTPNVDEFDTLIFVLPVYAWRIPHVVRKWIKDDLKCNGQKAYFVINCGVDIGNAGKYAEYMCSYSNLQYMGSFEIPMPENYILLYQCPNDEESLELMHKGDKLLEEATEYINKGIPAPKKHISLVDRFKSTPVNVGFYLIFVKGRWFYSTDKCTSCEKCVKECPLNNIKLVDGTPKWGNNCTHCLRCICYCPEEAIECTKFTPGKDRYRIPKY